MAAIGHQLFVDDALSAGGHLHNGVPDGGVYPPDLGHLHGDGGALLQIDLGTGVQDALAGAGAFAVVTFHIADAGVFADVEDMDAVVLAGLTAGIVDAAAGHNVHVGILADIEVVIDHVGEAGHAENHGDVDALSPGARFYGDVDAGLAVGLGGDVDVGGDLPVVQLAVDPEVVGSLGNLFQVGNLLQDLPFCLVHQRSPSLI